MQVLSFALQVFLLFVTAARGFDIPEEMLEVITALHDTCVGETGVSEDLIVKARVGDFTEDQPLKCYMKCLFDNMGCITDDGKMDVDALIAVFPEELSAKIGGVIKSCGSQMGADVCDTIFQTNKCYYKGNPDMYFLP